MGENGGRLINQPFSTGKFSSVGKIDPSSKLLCPSPNEAEVIPFEFTIILYKNKKVKI